MKIAFEDLQKYEFALSGIQAIYQRPLYRRMTIRGRECNGFLYITEGEMIYSWAGGEIELGPGSVIYLPQGSEHSLRSPSEKLEFYRVDFLAKVKDEVVLFSDGPMKITDEAPTKCVKAIENLERECRMGDNPLYKMEKICAILSSLQTEKTVPEGRLAPSFQYIHEHLTQGLDCGVLAEACYLGMAQFYKLFREEYGMTPLEYRDQLLMRRAVTLLDSGEISVTEVAAMLGFESVAYFSRFFKKHQGLSPSAYKKRH